MTIEVEYRCPTCDYKFVVYHDDDKRNTHCNWCGHPVELTGVISKIEGAEIVAYENGKEIGRRKAPKPPIVAS